MDDLRDYLADSRQRNPAYSLKGRTLASLGRQMREWHSDLEAIARIGRRGVPHEHGAAILSPRLTDADRRRTLLGERRRQR